MKNGLHNVRIINRNANMLVIYEYMSLTSGSKPEHKKFDFRVKTKNV